VQRQQRRPLLRLLPPMGAAGVAAADMVAGADMPAGADTAPEVLGAVAGDTMGAAPIKNRPWRHWDP
jgi:hypothetical protein